MNKEDYIMSVLGYVTHEYARQEIKQELESHIDDRIDYYESAGYDKAYSEQKAIEHMGDAKTVGFRLNELHNKTPLLAVDIAIKAFVVVLVMITIFVYSVFGGYVSFIGSQIIKLLNLNIDTNAFEVLSLIIIQYGAELLFLIDFFVCTKLKMKNPLLILGLEIIAYVITKIWVGYPFISLFIFNAVLFIISITYAMHISKVLSGNSNYVLDKRYDGMKYLLTLIYAVSIVLIFLEEYGVIIYA